MRTEFDLDGLERLRRTLEAAFAAEVAEPFGMDWQMRYASQRKRVAILVSRYDHCLAELLWRWRRGELYAEIPLVVSNHADMRARGGALRRPFEHVPVDARRQAGGRARAARAARRRRSTWSCSRATCRSCRRRSSTRRGTPIINIHHSFLPAFAGANPYGQAHERGVKLIGATAHYVTEELDDGPIIEQDVVRVSHRDSVDDLERARARRRAHGARARGAAGTSRTACSCTATRRSCSSGNARGSCRY